MFFYFKFFVIITKLLLIVPINPVYLKDHNLATRKARFVGVKTENYELGLQLLESNGSTGKTEIRHLLSSNFNESLTSRNHQFSNETLGHRNIKLKTNLTNELNDYVNLPLIDKNNFESVWNCGVSFDSRKREDAYQMTKPRDYPYSVLISSELEIRKKPVKCSGSLLTAEWVLSAAHCFHWPGDKAKFIWVYAGGNSLSELLDVLDYIIDMPSTAQVQNAAEFIVHPKYWQFPLSFDIALVRVGIKFNLTNTVNTIALSRKPWSHWGYIPCEFTAYGKMYSLTRDAEEDGVRKTQKLEAKKPCVCNFMLKIVFHFLGDNAADRYICAKPREDYGICFGDSGAGLACEVDGVMKLQGVAKRFMEFHDVNYCDFDLFSLYTKVNRNENPQCGLKNVISMFLDTCPHLPWLNNYVKLFSEDEISECQKLADSAAWLHTSLWTIIVNLSLLNQMS